MDPALKPIFAMLKAINTVCSPATLQMLNAFDYRGLCRVYKLVCLTDAISKDWNAYLWSLSKELPGFNSRGHEDEYFAMHLAMPITARSDADLFDYYLVLCASMAEAHTPPLTFRKWARENISSAIADEWSDS